MKLSYLGDVFAACAVVHVQHNLSYRQVRVCRRSAAGRDLNHTTLSVSVGLFSFNMDIVKIVIFSDRVVLFRSTVDTDLHEAGNDPMTHSYSKTNL